MIWSKKRQFIVSFCAFFVLGASFKVMTLLDGFTEVRPVNAIPMIAGLMFGPVGALGCAFGNVAADCFGTINMTSILGFVANFIAAYLPYRMWYLFSKEKPNVHTWRNIILYIVLSIVTAMAVAYFLAFGLQVLFGIWVSTLYQYVFYNDTGFAIFLGMPLFIVFTSDSIQIYCTGPVKSLIPKKADKLRKIGFLLFSICMLIILAGIYCGYSMTSTVWMLTVGIFSFLLLIFILV